MEKDYFVPINEVAKEVGVPAHTLRYWEKQFASAIRPVTGAGNRRYYRHETIEKIKTIKSLLYDRGMTIMGVKKILHNGEFGIEQKIAKRPVNAGENIPEKTPVSVSAFAEPRQVAGEIDTVIDLLNRAKELLD